MMDYVLNNSWGWNIRIPWWQWYYKSTVKGRASKCVLSYLIPILQRKERKKKFPLDLPETNWGLHSYHTHTHKKKHPRTKWLHCCWYYTRLKEANTWSSEVARKCSTWRFNFKTVRKCSTVRLIPEGVTLK